MHTQPQIRLYIIIMKSFCRWRKIKWLSCHIRVISRWKHHEIFGHLCWTAKACILHRSLRLPGKGLCRCWCSWALFLWYAARCNLLKWGMSSSEYFVPGLAALIFVKQKIQVSERQSNLPIWSIDFTLLSGLSQIRMKREQSVMVSCVEGVRYIFAVCKSLYLEQNCILCFTKFTPSILKSFLN